VAEALEAPASMSHYKRLGLEVQAEYRRLRQTAEAEYLRNPGLRVLVAEELEALSHRQGGSGYYSKYITPFLLFSEAEYR